ncbi:hypothetical protein EDB89DRAFT_2067770 [Lactarius sanguifluus]|nr:hypothetical protein EDB89DRAFT_2067770 [Lactarius sanguifluus]
MTQTSSDTSSVVCFSLDAVPAPAPAPAPALPGLRKIAPYWYPYTSTMRDPHSTSLALLNNALKRSHLAQRYGLESDVTTINDKVAKSDIIIFYWDRIENVVHRHEPPITSRPVKTLHEDWESEIIVVDKPGSIARTSLVVLLR